jgi:hypothetical protein
MVMCVCVCRYTGIIISINTGLIGVWIRVRESLKSNVIFIIVVHLSYFNSVMCSRLTYNHFFLYYTVNY